MSSVKFAVVGCGNVGSRHLAVIEAQTVRTSPGFATSTRRSARNTRPSTKGSAYDSIDDLLAQCDADVVNVCTPHYLHAEHALHAIRPAGTSRREADGPSRRECDQMIAAARQAGPADGREAEPLQRAGRPDAGGPRRGRLGRILMAQCNVIWNRYDGYYAQSPWLGRRRSKAARCSRRSATSSICWSGSAATSWTRAAASRRRPTRSRSKTAARRGCGSRTGPWDRSSGRPAPTTGISKAASRSSASGESSDRRPVPQPNRTLGRRRLPPADGIEWVDRPNAYGKYQGSSSNHDKVIDDVIRRVNREDFRVVSGEEARKTVQAIELIYARCSPGA